MDGALSDWDVQCCGLAAVYAAKVLGTVVVNKMRILTDHVSVYS